MSNESATAGSGPIIVFDGICVLCNGWVGFLLRHDHRARYRFAAMQGETGRRLLAGHGIDASDPTSFLLVENGRSYTDSEAIVRVLEGLGGAWRVARMLRGLPRGLRDRAYRTLARNRYRWFGTTACRMPTAEQRVRFLD